MAENEVVERWLWQDRQFHVTTGQFPKEGTEYLQLSETINAKVDSSAYFKTGGNLTQTMPLVFATRSSEDPQVQISMHYEGLPIEIMQQFLTYVSSNWKA
jgi:hypothetical protein